jgi:hypothetical protein
MDNGKNRCRIRVTKAVVHHYRMFEFHYPSLEKLQAALGDPDAQKTVGHAHQISTGGAPIIMVSAESQEIGA